MMLKEDKSSSSSSSRPDTKCIWSKEEDRLLVESMTLFENHRQQVLHDRLITAVIVNVRGLMYIMLCIDDEPSNRKAVIPLYI